MRKSILGILLCLSTASISQAEEENLHHFSSESLEIAGDYVFTIASFDTIDYFCTYTLAGDLAWEIPFGTKIEGWKLQDGKLYIFSKDRQSRGYFLSCVEAQSGITNWEKIIFSPGSMYAQDNEEASASEEEDDEEHIESE